MRETGAESDHLGLDMRIGPDEVSVARNHRQPYTKFVQGVPVHVNPVIMRATGAEGDHLGLDMKIGPDEVSVIRKHHPKTLFAEVNDEGVPVYVNPTLMPPTGAETEALPVNMTVGGSNYNHFFAQSEGVPVHVNPVIMRETGAESDHLGLDMRIGPDEVSVIKKHPSSYAQVRNPVVNPPFNNWSVNQPTVPHDHGLAGDADLGQHIIVDGHAISYGQLPY
jgi:hypothetical protein